MKRFGTIVSALLVLVALTQCKKEEQPTPTNGSEAVTITLDLKSNGGTKVDVNTMTGEVTYQNGDVIYVASGGHYIGTLTYNGTNFTGGITDPSVGEPLHFYFLGNVAPAETLAAGTTTTCSVIISDQTEHLPVIEYAPSNENYDSGATTYTAMLLNKCALVKFNVTTASEAATCITGMKNKVTVNFSENTLTHSQEGNGIITLPAGNGEKWAILLPQEAVETGEDGTAYSEDGAFTGTRGAVPSIIENGYQTAGIEVNVTTEVNPGEVPVGAICGKFTINANGDQVYFSQGNLQYQASTNTWRFASNQYDLIHVESDMTFYLIDKYYCDVTNEYTSSYNGWIDLFGWGTSGYNHGAVCYQPWSTSTHNEFYYSHGDPNSDLYGQSDWGYNAISNGGNANDLWRTLAVSEWDYIINSRNTSSGIRFAKASINSVNGIILLPDDWNSTVYYLNNTNQTDADWNTNVISSTQWQTLENNGAVFLPCAGLRVLNGRYIQGINTSGEYWTRTISYNGLLGSFHCSGTLWYGGIRYEGKSVRLVQNYNP